MTWTARADRLVQTILAPGAAAHIEARARDLLSPALGLILDVGCGFASPLVRLAVPHIGVDIDFARIKAADRCGGVVVADAVALPFADSTFAATVSIGLLHHLADAAARRAVGEMMRVVQPDGPVVILDGVRPAAARQRPLAAAIRALDRGRHMRDEGALLALFDGIPGWRHERVTYAATGLEGVWCIRPPAG